MGEHRFGSRGQVWCPFVPSDGSLGSEIPAPGTGARLRLDRPTDDACTVPIRPPRRPTFLFPTFTGTAPLGELSHVSRKDLLGSGAGRDSVLSDDPTSFHVSFLGKEHPETLVLGTDRAVKRLTGPFQGRPRGKTFSNLVGLNLSLVSSWS